jgi:D-galacturonate reductase
VRLLGLCARLDFLTFLLEKCQRANAGQVKLADLDQIMPTIKNTILSGAILEAGRRSLDEKRTIGIEKKGESWALV